jgi:hypothetical protein
MSPLVSNRSLFRFEIPLRRCKRRPHIDGTLGGWKKDYLLPPLMRLDGQEPWGQVYVTWDETGLYVACRVSGKREALRCDPRYFWKGDNLRLCTDMRDTRQIKRASRFCQQFYLLPAGGGSRGTEPVGGSAKLHRAQEDAPPVPEGRIDIAATVEPTEYVLTAHIPGECLSGFDPSEHRRIGLYYMLEDRDHGQQFLTVGDDLNWWIDPSTWATAVLRE